LRVSVGHRAARLPVCGKPVKLQRSAMFVAAPPKSAAPSSVGALCL
jgi:hypothetical protein